MGSGVIHAPSQDGLLGGSWVVISGAISPLIWVINIVTLRIRPLITTHEPPSMNRTEFSAGYIHGTFTRAILTRIA